MTTPFHPEANTSSPQGHPILPQRSSPLPFLRLPAVLPAAVTLALLLTPAVPRAAAQTTGAAASGAPSTNQQEAQPAEPPSVPAADQPAPAKPPATPAAQGGSAVDNATYMIGPEDNLQITVWREPTLSGVLPVRPDGMISLALLGDVKAAGLTPMQLGSDITARLRKYIQDPNVTVAVTAVNSQRVFLVGEVNKVGPVPFTPDMTPLQAISTAGGPAPYANTKRIYILRGTGARQQRIPFNYKQALKGESKPGVMLQPGDTIVVP